MKYMFSKKIFFITVVVFITLTAVSLPAYAAVRQSEGIVFIGPDEIIDDNLIVIADSLNVEGEIYGDVIVAAGAVNIKGIIHGDVLAAAGDITIAGKIDGDVRVVGGSIVIDSVIGGNVNVFGGKALINDSSEIGHSVSGAMGVLELNGAVMKNIFGAAGQATINAPVGGDVLMRIDHKGKIILGPQARVGGKVQYSAASELERLQGAEVAGGIKKIDLGEQKSFSAVLAVMLFARIISILGMLVVGLLIVNLFAGYAKEFSESMLERPGKQMLVGFAYFFLIPIGIILLLFTVIGIPLALMAAGIYAISLYLAKVFAALAIGVWIVKKISNGEVSLIIALIVGSIVVSLIVFIPLIGWLFCLLVMWWGAGAFVERYIAWYSS